RTLDFIDAAGLDYLHVFPFSPRPGTPAARMPQLPRQLIRSRAAALRAAGAAALERSLASRVGMIADTLIERPGFGRTEHYAPVRCPPDLTAGAVARLRLVAAEAGQLTGISQ
ncbi:MAG: tRNA (N(6)-L-threonylcarbamoyladenosine(37)-C(2))-methylthiotransferase MtaB, partial [Stellaceae bacterium]